MNAFALHDTSDQAGVLRWGISAAPIVAVHTGLIALGLPCYTQPMPPADANAPGAGRETDPAATAAAKAPRRGTARAENAADAAQTGTDENRSGSSETCACETKGGSRRCQKAVRNHAGASDHRDTQSRTRGPCGVSDECGRDRCHYCFV